MSTRDEISAELETVKAKIADLLDNPRPNYRVGDTSMDWGSYLESLNKIRWEYEQRLGQFATESWDSFDTSTDRFGTDRAEYQD